MSETQARHGKAFGEPGKYEVVGRVSDTTINPGDTVTIQLFISGYGKIDSSKLFFSPPPLAIFEEDKSYINAGVAVLKPDGDTMHSAQGGRANIPVTQPIVGFVWGQGKEKLRNNGLVLGLGGIGFEKWGYTTPFFDTDIKALPRTDDYQTPMISSETTLGKVDPNPPILVVLKLIDNITPGLYSMNFLFTYFNGFYWDNSKLKVDLTVRNIFQRNERLVSALGIAAAVGSVSGLIALGITIWQLLHPAPVPLPAH